MRTALVKKKELLGRLQKMYDKDEPIFIEEIKALWFEYSRPRVFQLLKEMIDANEIYRFAMGVYYFPSTSYITGGPLPLSSLKIAEKKYLHNEGNIFGYYSGMTLLNMVGLSNQVPNTREIVTSNESMIVRNVIVGNAKFLLRRAKVTITKKNAPILQVLEIFSKVDWPLSKYQVDNIFALVGGHKIDKKLVLKYANLFPKRALQNLLSSKVGYAVI